MYVHCTHTHTHTHARQFEIANSNRALVHQSKRLTEKLHLFRNERALWIIIFALMPASHSKEKIFLLRLGSFSALHTDWYYMHNDLSLSCSLSSYLYMLCICSLQQCTAHSIITKHWIRIRIAHDSSNNNDNRVRVECIMHINDKPPFWWWRCGDDE